MKLLAMAFLLLSGATSFAGDDGGVKITSFQLVDGTRLADICGQISPAPTTPTFVQVVVDPKHKSEAHYNTIVGSDGAFCITVTTYTASATATLLK